MHSMLWKHLQGARARCLGNSRAVLDTVLGHRFEALPPAQKGSADLARGLEVAFRTNNYKPPAFHPRTVYRRSSASPPRDKKDAISGYQHSRNTHVASRRLSPAKVSPPDSKSSRSQKDSFPVAQQPLRAAGSIYAPPELRQRSPEAPQSRENHVPTTRFYAPVGEDDIPSPRRKVSFSPTPRSMSASPIPSGYSITASSDLVAPETTNDPHALGDSADDPGLSVFAEEPPSVHRPFSADQALIPAVSILRISSDLSYKQPYSESSSHHTQRAASTILVPSQLLPRQYGKHAVGPVSEGTTSKSGQEDAAQKRKRALEMERERRERLEAVHASLSADNQAVSRSIQGQNPAASQQIQASNAPLGARVQPAGIGISLSPMQNGGMLVANLVPGDSSPHTFISLCAHHTRCLSELYTRSFSLHHARSFSAQCTNMQNPTVAFISRQCFCCCCQPQAHR